MTYQEKHNDQDFSSSSSPKAEFDYDPPSLACPPHKEETEYEVMAVFTFCQ